MLHKLYLPAVALTLTAASCSSNQANNTARRDTVKRKPITQSTSSGTDNSSSNQNGASNQSAPANAAPNTPSAPASAPAPTSGN